MRDIIITLFGSYNPLTDSNGAVLDGVASIDFAWIFGVIIFIIFLYCLLKILGGFINGR